MDKENGDRTKSKPGDANPLLDPLNVFAGTVFKSLFETGLLPLRLLVGFGIEYKYNITSNNYQEIIRRVVKTKQ